MKEPLRAGFKRTGELRKDRKLFSGKHRVSQIVLRYSNGPRGHTGISPRGAVALSLHYINLPDILLRKLMTSRPVRKTAGINKNKNKITKTFPGEQYRRKTS